MGSAAGSGGKAKGKSGSIPHVRAKIKGKKLGSAAKPTVASLFTAEGQIAVQKVGRTEAMTAVRSCRRCRRGVRVLYFVLLVF